MSWPTDEQFDKASAHGTEYALQEIANGRTEAQESPLSGEWADGMTTGKIAYNVGYTEPQTPKSDDEIGEWQNGVQELADAWERGYNDVYRSIAYAAGVARTYNDNREATT